MAPFLKILGHVLTTSRRQTAVRAPYGGGALFRKEIQAERHFALFYLYCTHTHFQGIAFRC